MKKIITIFLLFLSAVGIVLVFRLWQVKKTSAIPFSPQESSFVLESPADALTGKLLLVDGKVEKEPREKDEFEEVDAGVEILPGEKLTTGEKSQAIVEFSDFARIDLGSNSEISFVSLIPTSFLISQSSGSVAYRLLQDNAFISVRSLHVLLTFDSSTSKNKVPAKPGSYFGESEVTVKEENIIVQVLSGKAKLALVDLDNETHIWELEKGQKALINDAERKVEIK